MMCLKVTKKEIAASKNGLIVHEEYWCLESKEM